MGVRRYLTLVLLCSSQMTQATEHPSAGFICPLCLSFGGVPVKVLVHFLMELFVFFLSSFKSCLCILDNRREEFYPDGEDVKTSREDLSTTMRLGYV